MGEERVVARSDEQVCHAPDVFFGGHPMLIVETAEVDGKRVSAEGALAAEIVVMVEVAEGQFAQGAVDGRAQAESGEVGFCDAAQRPF